MASTSGLPRRRRRQQHPRLLLRPPSTPTGRPTRRSARWSPGWTRRGYVRIDRGVTNNEGFYEYADRDRLGRSRLRVRLSPRSGRWRLLRRCDARRHAQGNVDSSFTYDGNLLGGLLRRGGSRRDRAFGPARGARPVESARRDPGFGPRAVRRGRRRHRRRALGVDQSGEHAPGACYRVRPPGRRDGPSDRLRLEVRRRMVARALRTASRRSPDSPRPSRTTRRSARWPRRRTPACSTPTSAPVPLLDRFVAGALDADGKHPRRRLRRHDHELDARAHPRGRRVLRSVVRHGRQDHGRADRGGATSQGLLRHVFPDDDGRVVATGSADYTGTGYAVATRRLAERRRPTRRSGPTASRPHRGETPRAASRRRIPDGELRHGRQRRAARGAGTSRPRGVAVLAVSRTTRCDVRVSSRWPRSAFSAACVTACGSILGLPDGLDFRDASVDGSSLAPEGGPTGPGEAEAGSAGRRRARRRRDEVRARHEIVQRRVRGREPELRVRAASTSCSACPTPTSGAATCDDAGRLRRRVRDRLLHMCDGGASCEAVGPDNPVNCVGCGMGCSSTEVCVAASASGGTCSTTCPGGTTECDGGCVDTMTSPAHCGATSVCGVACPSGPSSVATCTSGKCRDRVPGNARRLRSRRVERLRGRQRASDLANCGGCGPAVHGPAEHDDRVHERRLRGQRVRRDVRRLQRRPERRLRVRHLRRSSA